MEKTLTRQLKIYCPQHQTTFEVAESPKIVCEIREHSLSNDFPNAEFWEYCCDCQTFFPADLEVGGQAKTACTNCERLTVNRFICGSCKIVSFDSGEDTKGKIFTVSTDPKTIEPACPGCSTVFSEVKLLLHKCEETNAVFLTSRQTCPFCKKISLLLAEKTTESELSSLKCPNCKESVTADIFFCGECGFQLNQDVIIAERGTAVAKTRLLGSICPTCGTANKSDSVFCGKCGQALKANKPEPEPESAITRTLPQTAPDGVISNNDGVLFNGQVLGFDDTVGNVKPIIPVKASGAIGCLTVIGVIFGGIILLVIIQAIVTTNKLPSANTNSNQKSNSNKATNSGAANSNLSTSFSTDYTGTIGKNNLSISMSLTRNGNNLNGTASTGKTDTLFGTIDNNGNFTLTGYENGGNIKSGIYKGKIYNDGSISGTWTNPQGGQSSSFSLSEE